MSDKVFDKERFGDSSIVFGGLRKFWRCTDIRYVDMKYAIENETHFLIDIMWQELKPDQISE